MQVLKFFYCSALIMAFVPSLVPPFALLEILLDITLCLRSLFYLQVQVSPEKTGKTIQSYSHLCLNL